MVPRSGIVLSQGNEPNLSSPTTPTSITDRRRSSDGAGLLVREKVATAARSPSSMVVDLTLSGLVQVWGGSSLPVMSVTSNQAERGSEARERRNPAKMVVRGLVDHGGAAMGCQGWIRGSTTWGDRV